MGCPYRKLSVDPPYLSYELTDGVPLWKALWHQRRAENSGVCWRPGIPHPRLMKSKCCYKSIISFTTFDCTTTTKQVEGGDRGYFFILPATTSLFKQRYTLAWCSCKCSTLEAVRSWDSKNTAVLEVSVVAFWTNPSPAMPASQTRVCHFSSSFLVMAWGSSGDCQKPSALHPHGDPGEAPGCSYSPAQLQPHLSSEPEDGASLCIYLYNSDLRVKRNKPLKNTFIS